MFIPINGLMNKGVTWIGGLRASSAGKICRYFFSFNGDGMITTDRRWNPDAVDASFEVLFYNDTSVALDTTIFQQSAVNNTASTELRINTLPSGAIRLTKGGTSISILTSSAPELGLGHWSIKYDAGTGDNIISKYKVFRCYPQGLGEGW